MQHHTTVMSKFKAPIYPIIYYQNILGKKYEINNETFGNFNLGPKTRFIDSDVNLKPSFLNFPFKNKMVIGLNKREGERERDNEKKSLNFSKQIFVW